MLWHSCWQGDSVHSSTSAKLNCYWNHACFCRYRGCCRTKKAKQNNQSQNPWRPCRLGTGVRPMEDQNHFINPLVSLLHADLFPLQIKLAKIWQKWKGWIYIFTIFFYQTERIEIWMCFTLVIQGVSCNTYQYICTYFCADNDRQDMYI